MVQCNKFDPSLEIGTNYKGNGQYESYHNHQDLTCSIWYWLVHKAMANLNHNVAINIKDRLTFQQLLLSGANN